MSIRRTPDEQPAISGDDRLMRGLPSVSEVVDTPCLALWLQRVPRRWVVDAARRKHEVIRSRHRSSLIY